MGLGKTIQTISLFALLHERKTSNSPHIVICPATTLTNWIRELQKWCPVLTVIAYYGTKAEREQAKKYIHQQHYDVILTTYNTAAQKQDRLFLKKLKFCYVVLDEAQNIKNNQSLRHKYLGKLQSEYRLLLTGTPLQNNLDELWALLNFIMPDIFSTELDLQSGDDNDEDMIDRRIGRMKIILAPFVLRRLKSHVSQDLPNKELKILECPMTDNQNKMYRDCIHQSKRWWQENQFNGEKTNEQEKGKDKAAATSSPSSGVVSASATGASKDSPNTSNSNATPKSPVNNKDKDKNGATETEEFEDPDDLADTDSLAPKKSSSLVHTMNNIFMELRKIANHPLLLRVYYTEKQIQEIAKYLSSLDEYKSPLSFLSSFSLSLSLSSRFYFQLVQVLLKKPNQSFVLCLILFIPIYFFLRIGKN